MKLSERELATVLAALRYWQRAEIGPRDHEGAIASNGGDIEPLCLEEIDYLCERLDTIEVES